MFYVGYETGTNTFSGDMLAKDVSTQDAIDLRIHAKLVATWREITSTSVTVRKEWLDGNNQDGIRPGSVSVQLYANQTAYGDAVALNDLNTWSYTWTGLPIIDGSGQTISYTVQEVNVPEGYTAEVSGSSNSFVISNSHTPEQVQYTVLKLWDDNEDADGMRPESIKLQLMANNVAVGELVTVEPDKDGIWKYTWNNIPKYANGRPIAYTAVEGAVELYEVYSYVSDTSNPNRNVATITNKYTPETTAITIVKDWEDSDNQDALRPESIQVQVYADGEAYGEPITLNADNNWSAQVVELPVLDNGNEIVYSVEELNVPAGYTAEIIMDPNLKNVFIITNTHIPETVTFSVKKVWDDGNDQDGKRPDSIQVNLFAQGALTDTVTLSAANNWEKTWTELPKNFQGRKIIYSAEESVVPEGYEEENIYADGVHTITNHYTPEEISFTVNKIWDDDNDQDGKRPDAIEVQLLSNGQNYGSPVTLSLASGWSYQWRELPRYSQGNPVIYSVLELPTEEYTAVYVPEVSDTGDVVVNVTNSYQPEKTDVTVSKVWNDSNNQDGIRTDSVVIDIFANGEIFGNYTLTEADRWIHTWSNLDKYENGELITYTVKEREVAGYTKKIEQLPNRTFVVTNTHEAEVVDISVAKNWEDKENQDGIRPDSVAVSLFADSRLVASKTLDADANWSFTWENLPKYNAGRLIDYSLTEESIPEGYTSEVSENGYRFTVTNTHETETTERSVSKVWDDNDNQDGKRPASVSVNLYADSVLKDTVTLNEANQWTYTWEQLDKNKAGEEIDYTVEEADVPAGYAADISRSGNAFVITNSHTPETVTYRGTKIWDDNNDQDGKRPDSVLFHLIVNGEHNEERSQTLSEANNWTCVWANLPKYADGVEIAYSVFEAEPEEYVSSYHRNINGNTIEVVITNTRASGKTSVSAEKLWNDNNDQDGIRPDRVEMELYANGNPTGKKVWATEVDKYWGYTWDNLDEYANGEKIVYTVVETPVEGYTATTETDPVFDNVIKITNTHIPETVERTVTKVWEDKENQDGFRPESILAQLYANGVLKESVALSETNNWTYTWEQLAKFEAGQEITYEIREAVVPEGYTSNAEVNGTTTIITNTHTPETIFIGARKVWNDENNQDGIRPESVAFKVLANGRELTDLFTTVTEDEDHNWKYTWTNLPKYASGNIIEYTVEEVASEGYEASCEAVTDESGNRSIIITNTHITEETAVSVRKEWEDGQDIDRIRPDYVIVDLLANGAKTGEAVVLSEENNWEHTWERLDMYRAGTRITYSVLEREVGGYSAEVEMQDDVFVITNTHTPECDDEYREYTIRKVWVDNEDAEGLRPDSIRVRAYSNGVFVTELELSEENNWTTTAVWLSHRDGTEYKWTVEEAKVPKGYYVSYDQNNLIITNTSYRAAEESGIVLSPQTGDDTPAVLWGVLMLSSFACIVVCMKKMKK